MVMYVVEEKQIFHFLSSFLFKVFESNLVLEGEDSKSKYAPSWPLWMVKRFMSYVILCIVLYHPNKLPFFLSFPSAI